MVGSYELVLVHELEPEPSVFLARLHNTEGGQVQMLNFFLRVQHVGIFVGNFTSCIYLVIKPNTRPGVLHLIHFICQTK